MPAASKYMHFLRPDRFPIWDSRVSRTCLGNIKHVTNPNVYLEYQAHLQCWLGDKKLCDKMRREIKAKKYKLLKRMTNLRILEFVMYAVPQQTIK